VKLDVENDKNNKNSKKKKKMSGFFRKLLSRFFGRKEKEKP